MTKEIDPLLRARECAKLVPCSEPTWWRWNGNGVYPFPPVRIGGMTRWPRSEVLEFIERAKAQRESA